MTRALPAIAPVALATLFAFAAPLSVLAALPVCRAPLATAGLKRQPMEMKVSRYVHQGKEFPLVEFASGPRRVSLNGLYGDFPHQEHIQFGRIRFLDGREQVLTLWLTAVDEWDATPKPGDSFSFDESARTATWSRPYDFGGKTATMRYTASILPDGRIAIDYDLGIPEEERAAARHPPFFCRIHREAFAEGEREWGWGDAVHNEYPADRLVADGRHQVNYDVGAVGSNVFHWETRDPKRHFSIEFPSLPMVERGMWVEYEPDDNGRRGSLCIFPVASATGRFVVDLGESETAALTPPPPVAGVDFWADDAKHVPLKPSRNLLMNGSFEQDFKGWHWEDWGARYTPCEKPREEIVEGGVSGRYALLLRGGQPHVAALCSAPFALESGRTYTVSMWVKAVGGKPFFLDANVRSVADHGTFWQFRGLDQFKGVTADPGEWKRHTFSFIADAVGTYVQIGPRGWLEESQDPARGVLVDAIQVEEGDAPTDFAEDPYVANLVTSRPLNDLAPSDRFDARLDVQAFGGAPGSVRVRIFDAYYEEKYSRVFPLAGSDATLDLGLDDPAAKARLGKGVFLVRLDFSCGSPAKTWTDYLRFSVIEPLRNDYPTAQLFAIHPWWECGNRPELCQRKTQEWGFNSTDGGGNRFFKSDVFRFAEAGGFRDYLHPVMYDADYVKDAAQHLPDGLEPPASLNPRDFTGTPAELATVELAAYRCALECEARNDVWTFFNEEEDWTRRVGFETHWRFIDAVRRGVSRAYAERGLPAPRFAESHGTSHYFKGRNDDTIRGYLETANRHGMKYDVVTIHPYGNIDKGTLSQHDLDEETQNLLADMKQAGYPESTPVFFSECFNMHPVRIPSWQADGWGDGYRVHNSPSLDFGNREFVMAASQARLYAIALKFWPKVRLVHCWNTRPAFDLRLTPWLFVLAANTTGHLLGDPEFVGDAQPYSDIRGYCFRDRRTGRAVMPVWTTNHDVEWGVKPSPVLSMELPPDVEFYDLAGNKRTPDSSGTPTRVPLTPAPLYLVSNDAEALLRSLRESVAEDPSTALTVNVLPRLDGSLRAEIRNETKARQTGRMAIAGRDLAYDLAGKESMSVKVADGALEPMKLQSWRGAVSFLPRSWATSWFVTPKCGDRPDWDAIPALEFSTAAGPKTPGFRAWCKTAWNPDFFFVRVEVEDPSYTPWEGDGREFDPKALYAHDGCLEIYFDAFADALMSWGRSYDENDSRYDFLGPHVHRLVAVNWQLAQGTDSATDEEIREKLVRSFARTEKGYVYEVAFAARYMAPVELKAGSVVGFGLTVHDYDFSRRNPQGNPLHTSVSNTTVPGTDCNLKPYLFPLTLLGEPTEQTAKKEY